MVWKGCERSVITYSSLISACEKAGHWELAMELFNEMHQEGCTPNTVTYNSLITACAQGQYLNHSTSRSALCFAASNISFCTVFCNIQHVHLHCILLHVMESAEEGKKAVTSMWEVCDALSAMASLAVSATFSCGWTTALP